MKGTREISLAIFAALEIAHGVMRALAASVLDIFQQPGSVSSLVATASGIAFIAFATIALRQFPYRGLCVIAAFVAFLLLPLVPLLIFSRSGHVLPIEWILRLPSILTVIAHIIQLGVAGFIYLWSVRRERGSFAAASTNLAS